MGAIADRVTWQRRHSIVCHNFLPPGNGDVFKGGSITMLSFFLRQKRCIAAVLLMCFVLSSCNPNETPSSSAQASSESGSVSGAQRAVVAIQQDFDSLDPHIASDTGTQEVMFNVFTGLVNTNTAGEIVPELALSWSISEDQLAYTFVLRPDLLFHDGSPVRPEDVQYSLLRLMGRTEDQTDPLSSSFRSVDDVVVVEDAEAPTVTIVLSEPDASLLGKLIVAIIPENSGADQAKTPLGAGPFRFVSYTHGVGMKLEKFESFYQEGLPKLDEVEFRIITDANTAYLALRNGDIDIYNVTLDQSLALPSDQFTVLNTPQNMVQLIAFNLDHEPFQDIRVRQALNHAVDKDEIIAIQAPGSQKLGTNFCEVMAFYAEKGLENTFPFDQEKARALLEEAGQQGLTFTLRLPSNYPFHIETAQIVKDQLNKVGVTMELDLIEWATWLTDVYAQFNHQSTLVGLTGKLDPDSVLGRFSSDHRNNFMRYANSDVDRLLLEGKSMANQDERAVIYKQIQTILAEEVPGIFIMDITLYRAINNRLTNLPTYPIGYIDMKTVEVR